MINYRESASERGGDRGELMNEGRNHGLDVFRILCMLMITVLHVNYQHFGLLYAAGPFFRTAGGFFIEYLCFCGVNGFALLSGFLMDGRAMRYDGAWFGKFASLWLKMVLWGVLIQVCGGVVGAKCSWAEIGGFLSPATSANWWYIGAYFGLLALLPLLSGGIARCGGEPLRRGTVVTFLLFSVMPTLLLEEGFLGTAWGYSTIWLVLCFIWGAALKRAMPRLRARRHLVAEMSAVAAVSVLFPWAFQLIGMRLGWAKQEMFFRYISPFCAAEAAALLVLCARIEVKRDKVRRALGFLSANALGIFLFQCHPLIWEKFVLDLHPPRLPLTSLLWRFPLTVLILAACGIVCNRLIDLIYTRSRLAAVPGWIWRRIARSAFHDVQ